MTADRFVWEAGDVTVTPPPPCQACRRRPADDDQVPGLCTPCAATIDSSYEAKRDEEAGP